jgi:hypothetical protein
MKIRLSNLLLLVFLLFVLGCKKDDNTVDNPVSSNDLFPLAVGNKLDYNEYEIDANGNKVSGTDVKTTRMVNAKLTYKNTEAYQVIDETSKNSVVTQRDTAYINKAANGDVKYYIAVEQELMPGAKLALTDWFAFYKFSEGVGKEYTVFKKDTIMKIVMAGMPIDAAISINVTGKVFASEQISVPAFTSPINATRVDINIKVTALGSITVLDQLFFQQWLSEGIGPIKERQPVISSGNGYYRELTKKYF